MATSAQLLAKDVVNALHDLTWSQTKNLTFHLGVELHTLDDIELDHRTSDDRKAHSVEAWLKNDIDAGWGKIVSGLRQINLSVVADRVAIEHYPKVKPTLVADPPSLLPIATSQALDHSQFPTESSEEVKQVREDVDELEQEFSLVVQKFRQAMMKQEAESPEVLDDFQASLFALPVAMKAMHEKFFSKEREDEILAAQSMRKVFVILGRYWNFSKYDLLQYLIKKFGNNTLKKSMHQYTEMLEKFEKKTSIELYLSAYSTQKEMALAFCQLAVRMNKPPSACTLHDVRRFKEDLANRSYIYQYSIDIESITTSSVKLTLAFHPSALGWVLAALNPRFLAEYNLIEVTVNGKSLHTYHNKDLNQMMLYASENGKAVAVVSLLNSGADVDAENVLGTPLIRASYQGHVHTVRLLLERGAKVDSKNKDSGTALYWASWSGNLDTVQTLLEYGASVDERTNSGRTSLICAAVRGHWDIMLELVKHGASVNAQSRGGSSALYWASGNGGVSMVKSLLERGANVDIQRNDRMTPIVHAARRGHDDVVQELLRHGANVNMCDSEGTTVLYWAASKGNLSTVQTVLEHGANVNTQKNDGVTALYLASASGNLRMVQTLLEYGAIVDVQRNDGKTPLIRAAMGGYTDVVQELMKHGASLNVQDSDGDSAVITATLGYHPEVVQLLAESGADLDLQNKEGLNALILAVRYGWKDIVDILLRGGCNVDVQESSTGWPALFFAAEKGDVAITNLLLEAGANVHLRDKDGVTALEVATVHDHEQVCEVLTQFIGTKPTHDVVPIAEQSTSSTQGDKPFASQDRQIAKQDMSLTNLDRSLQQDMPPMSQDRPLQQDMSPKSQDIPSINLDRPLQKDTPPKSQDRSRQQDIPPTHRRRRISQSVATLVMSAGRTLTIIFNKLDKRLKSTDEKSKHRFSRRESCGPEFI